jgi:hypothetical protein
VQLGNALVINSQVAVVLAADNRQIAAEIDRRAAFFGNELGTHGEYKSKVKRKK